jgi:hypothetical protein
MKLTARQKEIVRALCDGSRLYPPSIQFSRQWELRKKGEREQYVKQDTIGKMQILGILRKDVDPLNEIFFTSLLPTDEALQAIAK